MPYFLPNDVVGNDLVANGCKIVTVLYDKTSVDELKHCSSNLRTFIVETDQPTRIPHFVYWNGMGMGGRVMLTMTGRRPTCLRCSLPGHIRKNCETKFCRRCKRYGHELDNCTGGSWAGAARQGPDQAEGDLIDEDDDSLFDEALSSETSPSAFSTPPGLLRPTTQTSNQAGRVQPHPPRLPLTPWMTSHQPPPPPLPPDESGWTLCRWSTPRNPIMTPRMTPHQPPPPAPPPFESWWTPCKLVRRWCC